MKKAQNRYESIIKENKIIFENISRKVSVVGYSRLIVVIMTFILDYLLFKQNKYKSIFIFTSIAVILFLVLVIYHNLLYDNKRKIGLLISVNEDGLKRLNGEFKKFENDGSEYLNENHPYICDLDIFGKSSLFQLINTTITQGGKDFLSKILKGEIKNEKCEIEKKQEAINELAGKLEWRQKIIVDGTIKNNKKVNYENIHKLTEIKESDSILRSVIACTFIVVTFGSIFAVIKGIVPETFILLNLLINYAVIKILCKGIKEEIEILKSIKGTIKSYSSIVGLIEEEDYKSEYLKALRDKLRIKEHSKVISCKEQINNFSSLLDWIGDSEGNAFYLLLNLFFFVDVFLLNRIEKWKRDNYKYIENWLEVIHEVDALCSISNLVFEHDDWCFPTIVDKNIVSATNVSHPILLEDGIKNSFELHSNEKVGLITGSNMSGKSTFLRTISLNLILAYIGAPVCAEKFSCGIMKVYTCMRTKDNLEENISSFYAEILRIKLVIESCKKKENIFFVLDEIFKGTNSNDRHVGAIVLIKQLMKYGGVGLVSTHDLELCDLEKEDKRIVNYNFREFYEDNEIKFDYILRRGKSETQNAIHLMRLAGIEIN